MRIRKRQVVETASGFTTLIIFVSLSVPSIFFIPSSDTDMGTKEWGGGLSAVGMYVSGKWVVGGIVNQIWAGAGDNSPQVNTTTFQYIVNYNFPSGWYLTTLSTLTISVLPQVTDGTYLLAVVLEKYLR